MSYKRRALQALTRAELLEIGRQFELGVKTSMSVDEVRDVVARSKRATLDKVLPLLSRDNLKGICEELGLATEGREKKEIQERILEHVGGRGEVEEVESASASGSATGSESAAATGSGAGSGAGQAAPQFWLTYPEIAPPRPRVKPSPRPTLSVALSERQAAGSAPAAEPIAPASTTTDRAITLEVEPRKPRLAWQGMGRRELAAAVPTQVVEIVRPGRALDRGELAGLSTRVVAARDTATLPPNRLIWTNDNLVALQTLLDERDPETHDYRYRGKVDLVYIDPPFMVNSDFRADNAIDIDLDEDAGVQAKKEPSLVEILAYKDTWLQGLDSFLTMLRRRLELLKDLLAATGSIYVHLDWHAAHYVKVLMDEVFGYENFVNEVIWRRAFGHSDSERFGVIHDSLLFYQVGGSRQWKTILRPPDEDYIGTFFDQYDERRKERYQRISLSAGGLSGGGYTYEYKGVTTLWRCPIETLKQLDTEGRLHWPQKVGGVPRLKRYISEYEGAPVSDIWMDISKIHNQSMELLGYPTQKPVALLDRIISASCPPGGLVLDCFMGSGTTAEAAERLGRRWIGIDNSKYAIHLARKRLIQLHGQQRPPEKPQYDYVECEHCKNIERKEKSQRSPGPFEVRPFTVENMGVYQRAGEWQDFQTQRSLYRDEMIKVFGGEPVGHSPLLHGRKGGSWIHVGPLDGPVSVGQVWNIAREAQRASSPSKALTVLSADFDTLSGSEKEEIREKTGVHVTIRVIPSSAIDEVKRRLDFQRSNPDVPIESMAIPAFYAPLSIVLTPATSGRTVRLKLERCEVDIESFIASQRPLIRPISDGMTPAARKKAQAALDKWTERERELQKWLAKARSWQCFVDYWAVDWDYGRRVTPEGKPIFETDWQSFRVRRSQSDVDPLVFTAEFKYAQAGHYRVAARVTDVFGNDGIASINVEVR